MTLVDLRPLRAADFDRVLELERVLFGPGAWTYGMLAAELGGLGRWYVVAEENLQHRAGAGPVVGYAGLWFDGDVTQVMTIGVDPAYQGQGIGRRLLTALVERSRQLGAEAVLLEVRTDNLPALRLYERFGFERLGLRKRYYQPEDKDAYTMRLVLGAAGAVGPLEDAPVQDAPDAGRPDADASAGTPTTGDAA